jgi:hypothetical protein
MCELGEFGEEIGMETLPVFLVIGSCIQTKTKKGTAMEVSPTLANGS